MDGERLDFLTFVRRGDEDLLFNTQAPQWDKAVANAQELNPQTRSFSSVKPAMKGGYTVFNVWGENAGLVLNGLPREWVNSISRCDFRREYQGMSETMWQGAMAAMQATAPSGLTTTYIRSRPVTKTDRRDVGGHGFRYGSRKSDRSLIYYKRGGDKPCIEFRLQGKTCLAMARRVFDRYQHDVVFDFALLIEKEMWSEEAEWFRHTLKTGEVEHMAAMLGVGDRVLEAYAQATMFVETLEERKAWDALSTEEQEDLQKAKWDVTPKGAKHLTQNKKDPLQEFGDNLLALDDDLPF